MDKIIIEDKSGKDSGCCLKLSQQDIEFMLSSLEGKERTPTPAMQRAIRRFRRVDHMNMIFDRATTKARIESIIAQKKAFEAVTSAMGLQVESPLNEAFYSVFRTAFIAIEHAATGKTPVKDSFGIEGWLEWFVYENDCGERGHEAGYDGNLKPVKTIDDILDLMEEGVKCA